MERTLTMCSHSLVRTTVSPRHRWTGRVTVCTRAWSTLVHPVSGVEGDVSLTGPNEPLEGVASTGLPPLLREVFAAAGGIHDDWDERDRVMVAEQRTAVLSNRAVCSASADPAEPA